MPLRGGLERRVAGWVDAGILTADQQQQIIEFEEAGAGRSHRVLTILAVLGAALVFLGLVLVISQNWDEIGKLPKLATGIVLLIACHGGGYWLRNGPLGLVRTGEALLLLAGVLFGNLALISQQYHIAFNPAPLLLPVLCVAIAFAYLFASRTHAFVAAVLFALWLIAESQRGGSPIETAGETVLLLLLGAGAWLVALAALQRRSACAPLSPPLELVGGILIAGVVYLLGFYRHFGIESGVPLLPAAVILIVPMGLVAQTLLVTAFRGEARLGWPRIHDRLRPPLLLGQLTLLLLLIWTLVAALNPRGDAEEAFILTTLGYWLGACLLTASVVWLGLVLRRESWVNAALVFFGLFILSRYFDLFSDYSQTGALFAGAALLCLVLAVVLELAGADSVAAWMRRQVALRGVAEMRTLIRRRRLALFVLIVGIQMALVLAVIFIEEGRQGGVEIVLESLPVDPRDPVRGDYVILSYRAERLDDLPGPQRRDGEEVYVIFERRGRYWEPVSLRSRNLDEDEWDRGLVAIRARVVRESPLRVEYPNLGEYFVPQGTGVLPSPPDVYIAVSRDGAARIKYLEVEGERWPRD